MSQTHTSGSQSRLSTSKGGTIDWSIVSASSATAWLALVGEQGGGSAEQACIRGVREASGCEPKLALI